MEITNETVDKLSKLARLHFAEAEKEKVKTELAKMIGFVEKINELDLADIPPRLHMGDAMNILREDEVKGSITREEGLLNAPLANSEYFLVPKVIKK